MDKENQKSDKELEAQTQRLRDEIKELDRLSKQKLQQIQEMYRKLQELEDEKARLQAAKKK
jgi:hypothetical protein